MLCILYIYIIIYYINKWKLFLVIPFVSTWILTKQSNQESDKLEFFKLTSAEIIVERIFVVVFCLIIWVFFWLLAIGQISVMLGCSNITHRSLLRVSPRDSQGAIFFWCWRSVLRMPMIKLIHSIQSKFLSSYTISLAHRVISGRKNHYSALWRKFLNKEIHSHDLKYLA